ncbi:unnamed protein product (mitochondrion) [Plasmodiophora brassicae]|uniref:Phosphonoacetaldehyde hydrolase n=1 Tax=Plasmodiophora brassicae TaxID=37360 RepID=A0A0G4IR57_PLABS|nr:hypothetical protein PBRA_000963 [Plasmodiophora brassicae]SPQ97915.1 unnamed protein product [Plasmodiophora brassicae]
MLIHGALCKRVLSTVVRPTGAPPLNALPSGVRRLTSEERASALYKGPVKAVVLDWSGTVADAHVLAPAVVFRDVFAEHGVPITMEEARLPMGLRKDLHIEKILEIPDVQRRWRRVKNGAAPTPDDVKALFDDFVPLQVSALRKYSSLVPGAREAVRKLRVELGCKIGVTTGFTEAMVDVLLEDTAAQGFVPDASVAGDSVQNDMGFRPTPFMVYENLVRLGVYPIQSVVKVDDTVGGIGEGLNAGCWAVGIAGCGNYTNVASLDEWERMPDDEKQRRIQYSRDKLVGSGAHYVIDSIHLLPDVVNDVNARLAAGDRP